MYLLNEFPLQSMKKFSRYPCIFSRGISKRVPGAIAEEILVRISGEIPKVIAGGNPEEMSRTITIEILATSGVMPGRIPKRVLGESLERIPEKKILGESPNNFIE